MDVSDGHKDKSGGPLEHVIPQMVVTSANDDAEAIQTTTETYSVPVISSEIASTDGVAREETKYILPSETIPQQLTENGNPPKEEAIEDVTSEVEFKPEESVVHTVVQRPLIVDSEKCVPPCTVNVEPNFQSSSESSTALHQSLPPTTMQRPLIFDGSSIPQTENFTLSQEKDSEVNSQEFVLTEKQVLSKDVLSEDGENLNEEILATVADAKPKSSSFSWMPSFPKLHASGKEGKAIDVNVVKKDKEDVNAAKKDKELISNQSVQDSESSVKKDGLQNVKKFFDNLLHDTSADTKDKSKMQIETQEDLDVSTKKVHKDEKQSYYKKMFGPSKSESDSEAKVTSTHDEILNEPETKSKEPSKDSKYNIKKMFDSFKHDVIDKKDSCPPKDSNFSQDEKKSVVPEVTITLQSDQNEPDTKPKEQHKDSKYNIKKMFDSFKHDVVDKKDSDPPKDSITLQSDVKSDVPQVTITLQSDPKETDIVSKEQSKDSKYNLKKMFDSFKHDAVDKKDSSSKKDSEVLQSDKKSNPPKVTITSQSDFQNEAETVTKEQSKDSKYNIKKMFDSFKHDFVDKKDSPSKKETDFSQSDVKPDIPSKAQKDSKSGLKKFIDSLKHDGANVDETKGSEAADVSHKYKDHENESINVKSLKYDDFNDNYRKDVPELELPELTTNSSEIDIEIKTQSDPKKLKESVKPKPKDGQQGVKKLFSAFKHDGPSTSKVESGKFHVTFMERESSLKRSQSFRDSILLKDTQPLQESEKKSKDNLQGVKKYFSSSKHNESPECFKGNEKRKAKEIKRSQSCRETAAEKEGFHGIKSFFDSFSHKSSLKSSQSPVPPINPPEEHIYDTVGKPDPRKFPISAEGDSKKIDKSKEDQSSMKKLFDSFRHKDQSSKPKVKSNEDTIKKECEKVPSLPVMSNVTETGRILSSSKIEPKSKDKPKDMPLTKNSDQPKPKTVPKIKMTPSSEVLEPKTFYPKETAPSIQENRCPNITDGKTSVFNTISDNFMAIKDRVLHSKESKKNEGVTNDTKFEEYDLQRAVNQSEVQPSTSGTYKPINDAFININISHEAESKTPADLVSSQNKFEPNTTIPQITTQQSVILDTKKSPKVNATPTASPGTPETLYDTCCMRLAVLLGKKAMEIVSDQTKSPPKKPPKPSAEAIAKARAAVVSKRLREIQNKTQSIGENIPVGYDGIRFADDETESSCDYKDVDNFDYIMDYELINRYKCDSKLDTFTDPSTCSGISSYYTADTVTLKDENFSDAPLETVSLNSNDSYIFQNLSLSQGKSEIQTWPSSKKLKNGREQRVKSVNNKIDQNYKDQRSVSEVGSKLTGSVKTSAKKIPPPIPPKPILSPKYTVSSNKVSTSVPDTQNSMSQCINGLSLSPRMQAKFSKDSAVTKQRPLVVAGFKGTEFTGLQTKSKENQSKQMKERKFNTVLKNESLKKISTISSLDRQPLQISKSSPSRMLDLQSNNQLSTSKKISPQRPPLPNSLEHSRGSTKVIPPPVPEKPKRERVTLSYVPEEKRTVSPPRPPPPSVINKVSVPPPRPPPPFPKIKPLDKHTFKESAEDEPEKSDVLTSFVEVTTELDDSIFIKTQNDNEIPLPVHHDAGQSTNVYPESNIKLSSEITCPVEEYKTTVEKSSLEDTCSWSKESGEIPHPSEGNRHALKVCEKNFVSDSPEHDSVLNSTVMPQYTPKPPPRTRRIRSRTVEIVPTEKMSESNLRRSQSLSDIDVHKRTSHLDVDMPTEKADLKNLYTSVNKDGKRTALNGSQSLNNLEKVSGRPLPAPPPPPRKFRSLDRKPKEKQKRTETDFHKSDEIDQIMPEAGSSDLSIKPPDRKRKSDKHRFLSLSTERKKPETQFTSNVESLRMPRSNSAPMRPERRFRHVDTEYDENANIAFPIAAEVHHSAVVLDECGNEILEASSCPNIPVEDIVDSKKERSHSEKVTPHPRQRKGKNPKDKSHSSWYDKTHPSEESWEMVNWDSTSETAKEFKERFSARGVIPTRRKSDPSGSRIGRTSKFYVNVDDSVGGLPLLDKETSPLHIDCSEKSVQTSLETLSQGIVSRDEQSESSDNTDNLLNIVKTLQSELKVTLNRHKSLDDEDNNSSNVATDSEKLDIGEKKSLKTPSAQSSTSDLWPLTSSDESEGEVSCDSSVNLSEIALTRKKNKIFYIAQEIMTSEEVFVDTLKLLNVDFKAAVETASKQKNTPVIPEEVLGQILNHLPQLQHLNENLMMELKDRIDNWDKTEKIADIIVKMGPFLKLYSWFIHDFESNLSLLEESKKKYPLFAQVVKEFEASARCKRLTLNHYMLKPIQRIPQYRLLLQEYLHHLSEESPDYQDTVTALQIVSEVANHANDSMKQGDNAQKLISIQNSIMGHKEIIKPGRLFLKEGVLMKLSRKGMQPRWFVLFNDLLLYLTPVQQGLYRINHELPLTGMKVAIPIQQDYQNEFSIISVTRSFTLAARSQEERQEWIVALTKAIEENASKRSTFTHIRLQQRAQGKNSEDDDGEFVLGNKAPVWIPDARVTMCQLCTSEFTVTFRRHHCRACGKVVCSICSGNRISLHYLGGNKVNRVCDECYAKLGPDAGGSPENAETDSDNQQIAVKPHLRTEHRYVKKGKRNLPSVLKEVCANDQGSTISGYLQKRSGKSWKKAWFVVKDKVIYEYKASEDVAALRSIPLLGYQIETFSEAYENVDSSLLFQLTHPGQAPIIFHADSVGSTERWIAALKEASVLE